MQIKCKNGKTVEASPVPTVNGTMVEILNCRGDFYKTKDAWVIKVWKASAEFAQFFGVPEVTGKESGVRIEDESYEALHAACLQANRELKAQQEAERQAMIATRPQWTGLVFEGWTLAAKPSIRRLYQAKDDLTWYEVEIIKALPEIRPADARELGLKAVVHHTRFESACYEVTEADIDALARLSHERHEPKRLAAEEEKRKKDAAEAARQAREQYITETYDIVQTAPKRYNEDGDYEVKVTVTVKATRKQYQFSARNIEDFGLAINPVPGGGLAIDVESFMKHNNFNFDTEAKRQAYRESHPTPTGWGWDRYYSNSGEKWVPMTEEEVDVYKVVGERLRGYSEIRM